MNNILRDGTRDQIISDPVIGVRSRSDRMFSEIVFFFFRVRFFKSWYWFFTSFFFKTTFYNSRKIVKKRPRTAIPWKNRVKLTRWRFETSMWINEKLEKAYKKKKKPRMVGRFSCTRPKNGPFAPTPRQYSVTIFLLFFGYITNSFRTSLNGPNCI